MHPVLHRTLKRNLIEGVGGVPSWVLSEIGWDQINYPLTFWGSGLGGWHSSFDRNYYLPDSLFGTTYYVDKATGSNSNDGLTTGAKVKSIWKATELGNALGAPYKVVITGGSQFYDLNDGFVKITTPTPNTQKAAYVATGGRVLVSTHVAVTWPGSPDATYTNTYKATRGNVGRVVDLLNSTHGDYNDLTKVADATACDATPNSWAQVGGNLYVRRGDAAAVVDANTRVYLVNHSLTLVSTAKDLYLSGIDLEGGISAPGALYVQDMVGNIIAEDCTFKYAGSASVAAGAVSIINCTGLFAFKNCTGAGASTDGFGVTRNTDTNRLTFLYTENCIGIDNGRFANLSCNGLTAHNSCTCIDVNGVYDYSLGAQVHLIDDAGLLALGTYAAFGLPDGGANPNTGFRTDNTAEQVLIDCKAEMSSSGDYALIVGAGSVMKTRNFNAAVGRISAVGSLTTF